LDLFDLAASRDRVLAETFGGGAQRISESFLREWQQMVERVQGLLADPKEGSRVVLVTTPEEFSLQESLRAKEALQQSGMRVDRIVLNRTRHGAGACPRCKQQQARTKVARTFLKRNFRGAPLIEAAESAFPVAGVSGLAAFARSIYDGKRLPAGRSPRRE